MFDIAGTGGGPPLRGELEAEMEGDAEEDEADPKNLLFIFLRPMMEVR
jgi:hypothetical protein